MRANYPKFLLNASFDISSGVPDLVLHFSDQFCFHLLQRLVVFLVLSSHLVDDIVGLLHNLLELLLTILLALDQRFLELVELLLQLGLRVDSELISSAFDNQLGLFPLCKDFPNLGLRDFDGTGFTLTLELSQFFFDFL